MNFKIIVFFAFYSICFQFSGIAQSKLRYDDTNKEQKDNFIIIQNDTLFASTSRLTDVQLKNFCKNLNTTKTISLYKDIVFNNLHCSQFERVFTKQWINEIRIYFDVKIPKSVQKQFKTFYSNFKIENLNLTFVRNKKKANYFITTTKDIIPNIESVNNKSELYPYNHITYNLATDNNSKFYSGILKINLETITNKTLVLPKLKQLFFMSLGQFTTDKDVKENSLLSYRYENSNQLSKEDLDLLQLHYLHIHDTPLSCHYFSLFIKDIQSKCIIN